jgi:ferredoxin
VCEFVSTSEERLKRCPPGDERPRQLYRRFVRAFALAAAVAVASGSVPAWRTGFLPSLSPFNALLAVAAGAGALFMLGALALALACMFRPRFFCRWLCPTGTCQDALSFFVKRRKQVGRVPQIGVWLVWLGLGAALAGYPLFGCLDPLVLFNAAFSLTGADSGVWAYLAVAGLPTLLFLALLVPGLWCGRLCPLGALQDLLRLPARAWVARKQGGNNAGALIDRRAFIGLGLGAGYRLALNPARAKKTSALVRPPSRVDSSRFTRLCVRCGACARACPAGIIRFGGAAGGWHGILAPVLCFDDNFCEPSCTVCGQACPSGAIPRFTVRDKYRRPLGAVAINHDRCLLNESQECGTCVASCPFGALDLDWDPNEMVSRLKADNKLCTGCGCCEYVCPAMPKAIVVKGIIAG